MFKNVSIALLFAFAGCSGGVSGGANGAAPLPAASQPPAHSKARASLTIHVPKRIRVRRGRGTRYVSPSAQSISIVIDPAAGCTTCSLQVSVAGGLTPGSPDCTTGSSGTTCTFDFVLSPGSYTGTIATYDGGTGCAPSCHTLSANQSFPLTVVPGQANLPSLTLYGVVASLAIISATNNLWANNNIDVSVGGINAKGSALVYGVDADGNLILGPGAPAFSVPAQPAAGWAASFTGNALQVTSPGSFASAGQFTSLTIAVQSPSCQIVGTTCSFTLYCDFVPLLAIADGAHNDVRIVMSHTYPALTYATVTNGVSAPSDVKFDKSGDLLVANKGNGSVTVYAPPYTAAPAATITAGLSSPTALALCAECPATVLAVADSVGKAVNVYQGYSAVPVALSLGTAPTAIAFDAYSNIWIGVSGSVLAFSGSTGYTGPPSPDLSVSNPTALLIDYKNNVYIGDSGSGTVKYYASPGYTASYVASGLNAPSSLLANGESIYACSVGGETGYSIPLLQANETPLTTGGTTPCLQAMDEDQGLYVYDPGFGSIEATEQIYGIETTKTVSALAVFPGASPYW